MITGLSKTGAVEDADRRWKLFDKVIVMEKEKLPAALAAVVVGVRGSVHRAAGET